MSLSICRNWSRPPPNGECGIKQIDKAASETWQQNAIKGDHFAIYEPLNNIICLHFCMNFLDNNSSNKADKLCWLSNESKNDWICWE